LFNPYGKSMVSIKTSGFPWLHTKYQLSDLRFDFLDVENPSVNPYRKFMVSPKIDVFLTYADTQAIKQADNFFFQDSSLREREYTYQQRRRMKLFYVKLSNPTAGQCPQRISYTYIPSYLCTCVTWCIRKLSVIFNVFNKSR
jgi:hypothetical protein